MVRMSAQCNQKMMTGFRNGVALGAVCWTAILLLAGAFIGA
jgi:hypothetical protein